MDPSHDTSQNVNLPGQHNCLLQTRIVFLSVLAPALGWNVLVGSNGSSFPRRGDLKEASHDRRDSDTSNGGVALPLRGVDPPSSIGGPNLRILLVL